MNPQGTGASSLSEAIDALRQNGSVALLEQERQTLIEMTAPSGRSRVARSQRWPTPQQILGGAELEHLGHLGPTTGGGVTTVSAPAPDPGTAQSDRDKHARRVRLQPVVAVVLPVLNMWNRESGWNC